MIISVVPDLVPLVDNASNKRRITLGVHAHEEKRRFYICCFQNVQDLWRPPRIRAVVKSDCNLMLAAGALVIKRWELGKLHILRSEIAICIHSELSHPVGAILVNSDNLAVANIRYCVRRLYQFERLSRLIVDFEIPRNAQGIPNCWVFAAESIDSEAAGLVVAHRAQLVEECYGIQEPDGVLLLFILKIKVRAVTRSAYFYTLDFGVIGAAHCFGKTDQLRLFPADGPVISVATHRDDPLLGVRIF